MSGRSVLIRTGGLGDFVLSVPLLCVLAEKFAEVVLVTKPRYFPLVDNLSCPPKLVDADLFEAKNCAFLEGSTIFTFWNDEDFLSELEQAGADEVQPLISRPNDPPHVTERMFCDAKLPTPENLLEKPWLGSELPVGKDLWLHPGSGSASKNMPLSIFVEEAESWLSGDDEGRIVFSFGEADEAVEEEIYSTSLAFHPRVDLIQPVSNADLNELLLERAIRFIGNDSGPAHLAASLGIPTQVFFRTTDPEIWRPLGPGVEILQPSPDSN